MRLKIEVDLTDEEVNALRDEALGRRVDHAKAWAAWTKVEAALFQAIMEQENQ